MGTWAHGHSAFAQAPTFLICELLAIQPHNVCDSIVERLTHAEDQQQVQEETILNQKETISALRRQKHLIMLTSSRAVQIQRKKVEHLEARLATVEDTLTEKIRSQETELRMANDKLHRLATKVRECKEIGDYDLRSPSPYPHTYSPSSPVYNSLSVLKQSPSPEREEGELSPSPMKREREEGELSPSPSPRGQRRRTD